MSSLLFPGVKEDVTELILNLKGLAAKMYCDTPKQVTIDAQGPCEVTAADIHVDDEVEVINPDTAHRHAERGCASSNAADSRKGPRICERGQE